MASEATTMGDAITRFILITQLRYQNGAATVRNEEGAAAVEYALLVTLIAGAIILAVTTLGLDVIGLFDAAGSAFG